MLVNACCGPYRASREHARDDAIRARGVGGPLSSAILYLAIIAIWAGALVPRWLRPAQAVTRSADNRSADARAAASRSAGTRAAGARSANARAAHARHREDADEPWQGFRLDTEPIPVVRPERDQWGWRPGPIHRGAAPHDLAGPAAHAGHEHPADRRSGGLTAIHWPPGGPSSRRDDAWRFRPAAARGRTHGCHAGPGAGGSGLGRAAGSAGSVESAPAAEAERPMSPSPSRPDRGGHRYLGPVGDQLYDQYADAAVRAVGD